MTKHDLANAVRALKGETTLAPYSKDALLCDEEALYEYMMCNYCYKYIQNPDFRGILERSQTLDEFTHLYFDAATVNVHDLSHRSAKGKSL